MSHLADDIRALIAGRVVVASVSGGKDSAAMSLWLHEQGIEHVRVFADTGWEHPRTYEYLRGALTEKLGPIHEVRGPRGMADLVRHRGMFPSRTRRFCTEELKVKPLAAFVRSLDDDVVNAVGIRAAESAARAHLPEWEYDKVFDCDVWRPLLRWSEQDVIDIHTRHGLRPNPLYLDGARRVGCWPCIHTNKEELRFLADTDPAKVDEIRSLEREVAAAAGWIDDNSEVAEAFAEWRAELDGVCPLRRSVMVSIDGVARYVSVVTEKTTTWRAEPAKEVA